ncbi:hypothetical protein AGMMS49928_23090 [Spirochaetia bacterium]|nr:hypothetical protein AGMMS49928_23090 [Spirochaetia bacterium]
MSFFCKKNFIWILSLGLFITCAGQPKSALPPEEPPPMTGGENSVSSEKSAEKPAEKPPDAGKAPKKAPEKTAMASKTRPEALSRTKKGALPVEPERAPEIPKIEDNTTAPERILGKGRTNSAVLAAFLRQSNPKVEEFADQLAQLYVEEAAVEGINHDVAFSQMLLETGFLRFGGLVSPDMYNFCGLGAIGPEQPGETFPDPRTGVRAHIQHLKAYASEEPLKQPLVDPRYHYVRRGSAPSINGLAGTWAADRQYAEKITGILERLRNFSSSTPGN